MFFWLRILLFLLSSVLVVSDFYINFNSTPAMNIYGADSGGYTRFATTYHHLGNLDINVRPFVYPLFLYLIVLLHNSLSYLYIYQFIISSISLIFIIFPLWHYLIYRNRNFSIFPILLYCFMVVVIDEFSRSSLFSYYTKLVGSECLLLFFLVLDTTLLYLIVFSRRTFRKVVYLFLLQIFSGLALYTKPVFIISFALLFVITIALVLMEKFKSIFKYSIICFGVVWYLSLGAVDTHLFQKDDMGKFWTSVHLFGIYLNETAKEVLNPENKNFISERSLNRDILIKFIKESYETEDYKYPTLGHRPEIIVFGLTGYLYRYLKSASINEFYWYFVKKAFYRYPENFILKIINEWKFAFNENLFIRDFDLNFMMLYPNLFCQEDLRYEKSIQNKNLIIACEESLENYSHKKSKIFLDGKIFGSLILIALFLSLINFKKNFSKYYLLTFLLFFAFHSGTAIGHSFSVSRYTESYVLFALGTAFVAFIQILNMLNISVSIKKPKIFGKPLTKINLHLGLR